VKLVVLFMAGDAGAAETIRVRGEIAESATVQPTPAKWDAINSCYATHTDPYNRGHLT